MGKRLLRLLCIASFLIFSTLFSRVGFASFDRDLVKETQSDVVPVTEELLTREGEPGPASPTFKMPDTSKFLVKKPYDQAVKDKIVKTKDELSDAWWNEWFFWEGDEEKSKSKSEPIDTK